MTEAHVQTNGDSAPLSERASAQVQRPPYWRDIREMLEGESGPDFERAFFEVQKQVEPSILGDKANAFSKSTYASLANVLAYVRPILHEHGFTLRQFAGAARGHGDGTKKWYSLPVATRLTHVESGQWEMIILDIPIDQTPISVGSAMTYGKRYGLLSFLGIATADEDAMTFLRNRLDQEAAEEAVQGIVEKINECESQADLKEWADKNDEGLKILSEASLAIVRHAYGDRQAAIKAGNGKDEKK